MIVIQLMGGLGNQMFEYAAGLSLAKINHTALNIDLSWFDTLGDNDVKREYELDSFRLKQDFVDPSRLYLVSEETGLKRSIKTINANVRGKLVLGEYREVGLNYNKNFEELTDNTYLSGYFQSEKYFIKIRPDIVEAFSFKNKASKKSVEIIKLAKNTNSVSLHVRRGDYVTSQDANSFHGLKGVDYYKKAMKIAANTVDTPRYFIFSDDISWCRYNLPVPKDSIFVEHNTKGVEDLRIMTNCKHNIIANSSFSWWGAWLGDNDKKLVIAPKKWFVDSKADSSDIIPHRWKTI